MAIKKRTFKSYLRHYISMGMSPKEAYQRMLEEGFDDSIVGIPNQINNLINSGIPFERALSIVQDAAIDNNFDSYKAALQEYNDRKRRVYRSPEPNGRDRIDVDRIVRDTLSNKPELGNGYYPPMGMSTFPNSQHSQYSVVPNQPIIEGMTPIPTKYPYELGTEDNQNLAPEGKLGLPISGMYDESAVSTDMDEPSGKVVVGPDEEVPAQPVQTVQSAQPVNKPNVTSVVKPKRVFKPTVVNNTPVAKPVSTPTSTVVAPTLSSVTSQAVRHNGGFNDYRRQSVLSALRAAGGISPAEAVQRGIIPLEALNYV